jgi:hypothetical protein
MLGDSETQLKRQKAVSDKKVISEALKSSDEFIRKANLAQDSYRAQVKDLQEQQLSLKTSESGKHSEHDNGAREGMIRNLKPVKSSEPPPARDTSEPMQPNISLKREPSWMTSLETHDTANQPPDDQSDTSSIMPPRIYSDSANGSMITLARGSVETFRS